MTRKPPLPSRFERNSNLKSVSIFRSDEVVRRKSIHADLLVNQQTKRKNQRDGGCTDHRYPGNVPDAGTQVPDPDNLANLGRQASLIRKGLNPSFDWTYRRLRHWNGHKLLLVIVLWSVFGRKRHSYFRWNHHIADLHAMETESSMLVERNWRWGRQYPDGERHV
ncbi:hypothetical protein BJ508DRAFT_14543 [Ascobolus immersus RN42]|uniref:Uncharacterized protein n=1 Tax=Ascobolus immersus RN42 TaxID=1160509 RepID=A0A3N4HRI3_ASCIM|nr:hypothetical protein BJ508DRAFT_14543 [Ascobolus immersus RN42]